MLPWTWAYWSHLCFYKPYRWFWYLLKFENHMPQLKGTIWPKITRPAGHLNPTYFVFFPYHHFALTCNIIDLNFLTLTYGLSSARIQEPQKQGYLSAISLRVVLSQSLFDTVGGTELLASFQDYSERPPRSRVPHLLGRGLSWSCTTDQLPLLPGLSPSLITGVVFEDPPQESPLCTNIHLRASFLKNLRQVCF